MDPQTRRAIQSLTRELQRTQAELARVKRGSRRPQLGHSSIDSGALEVRDPDTGVTRLRLGYQPDGSVGVVPEGGDPPPAPSTPIVAGAPVGVMVQWDGRLAHDQTLPADFDHVSVHVSQVQGFVPDAATFQGTIPRAGGLFPVVPLEVGTTYYVRLVGVGTGGAEGAPSEEASGVPEAVGGVPPPGSITETEIADDAVTTPKIRAEAVEAYHIVAQAIEAGHIQAQAIEAAHLAATIVLASRLVAGNPGAARVEIDEDGLRGYSDDDELIFAIADGDAVFSGDITGSQISGSRIVLSTPSGASGVMDETSDVVSLRVTSPLGARAQLAASGTQAEFSTWGDHDDPNTPAAGVLSRPEACQISLYSDVGDINNTPFVTMTAQPGETRMSARSGSSTSTEVRVRARQDWSSIDAIPPASTVGEPDASAGVLYAFRRSSSDAPTLSIQSPMSTSGPGAGKRSIVHVEGANTGRSTTVINHAARQHYFQGELVDGDTDTTTSGVVQLAPTHSIAAPFHAPAITEMTAEPTATSTGDWVDFTSSQFPPVEFRTPWSGRVRITITMCGINNRTNASTISVGFRLSGGSTVAPSLQRAAMVRSTGSSSSATAARQQCVVVHMDLSSVADYTLTPAWRISGSGHSWDGVQAFDLNYQQSIVVEALT